MLERYLHQLKIDDCGTEDPVATRERLKARFPAGSTRRMTQLGLIVSAALADLAPTLDDTVVYASAYGESRALESYLDSFPTASPTLFQTSIHPSAVQQAMILRQQPVHEFLPMTGWDHLAAQALQAALLSPASRVILCGGEERGTWLLEHGIASPCSFGFALALTREPAGALARLALSPGAVEPAALSLRDFFQHLAARRPLDQTLAAGRFTLTWL